MVRFSLNTKTFCLYVIWGKQDQIWAKIFCIPKNRHSRTPVVSIFIEPSHFGSGAKNLWMPAAGAGIGSLARDFPETLR